jgi:hypothetical protein
MEEWSDDDPFYATKGSKEDPILDGHQEGMFQTIGSPLAAPVLVEHCILVPID